MLGSLSPLNGPPWSSAQSFKAKSYRGPAPALAGSAALASGAGGKGAGQAEGTVVVAAEVRAIAWPVPHAAPSYISPAAKCPGAARRPPAKDAPVSLSGLPQLARTLALALALARIEQAYARLARGYTTRPRPTLLKNWPCYLGQSFTSYILLPLLKIKSRPYHRAYTLRRSKRGQQRLRFLLLRPGLLIQACFGRSWRPTGGDN